MVPKYMTKIDKNSDTTKEIIYIAHPGQMPQGDDEIDLVELWLMLWRRKWLIIGITALATLVAALITTFVIQPEYKATATIRAVETEDFSNSDFLASLLTSNLFKRKIIQQNTLLPHYFPEKWNPQEGTWRPGVDTPSSTDLLTSGRFPLKVRTNGQEISLTWSDADPEFAANQLEKTLDIFRNHLREATPAETRQIATLDTHIQSIQEIKNTAENSDELNIELASLLQKKAELESQRDLYQSFTLINEPLPPSSPAKPRTTLILTLTLAASLFAGVFLAFLVEFIQNARQRIREGYYTQE